MPVLPGYSSQRNIQAETQAPLRRGEAEQPFIQTKKVADAIGGIAERWQNAQDVMLATDRKAKFNTALTELKLEASLDPQFENTEKYRERIQKIKNDILKGVPERIKSVLLPEFESDAKIAEIKIGADFGQKAIKENKYQLATYIQEQQAAKATASPAEVANINKMVRMNLDAQVATGLITQQEAVDILQKAEKDAAIEAVFLSPRHGINLIDSGVYNLTEKEKSDLKTTAREVEEKQKKEQQFAIKEQQKSNELSIALDLSDKSKPKLSMTQISNMMASGDIGQDFAEAYAKLLKSPKVIKKEGKKDSGFLAVAQSIFSAETDDEMRKKVVETMLSGANGDISEKQLGILLKAASDSTKRGFINNVIESYKNNEGIFWSPYRAVWDFLKDVAEGKDVETAKRDSTKRELQNYNKGFSNIPDDGEVRVDPKTGVKAIVYKDGTYKIIEDKK
jgi:hypothetical protein